MSMEHKAFVFDWTAFALELLTPIVQALSEDDIRPLKAFVEAHRTELTDPYEGEPLPEEWRSLLETGDTQELADFALTRYYRPTDDHGIGSAWSEISDELTQESRV